MKIFKYLMTLACFFGINAFANPKDIKENSDIIVDNYNYNIYLISQYNGKRHVESNFYINTNQNSNDFHNIPVVFPLFSDYKTNNLDPIHHLEGVIINEKNGIHISLKFPKKYKNNLYENSNFSDIDVDTDIGLNESTGYQIGSKNGVKYIFYIKKIKT